MKIDLTSGINFEIGGELGKYKTLPLETLIEISKSFQDLVINIARHDVKTETSLDLNLFKLELANFSPGSAIPTFIYTPRIQSTLTDYELQRKQVDQSLDQILDISNTGDYLKIINFYPDAVTRNEIVEGVFNFRKSFGKSPVYVVDFDKQRRPTIVYKLHRFKPAVRDKLITKVEEISKIDKVYEPIVKYKVSFDDLGIKHTKKLFQVDEHGEVTYKVQRVKVENRVYILHSPLLNQIEKEDNYYVIRNLLLDIVATGKTQMEAEMSFGEEFDYVYRNYNSYSDDQLTDRLKRIKIFINNMVNKIE